MDIYKKDDKITINSELSNDEDVINEGFLDKKLSNIEGHLSLLEKDYNEFKILSDKQSRDEVLNRTAVKTTIKILYDRGLFKFFSDRFAYDVLKELLFA